MRVTPGKGNTDDIIYAFGLLSAVASSFCLVAVGSTGGHESRDTCSRDRNTRSRDTCSRDTVSVVSSN